MEVVQPASPAARRGEAADSAWLAPISRCSVAVAQPVQFVQLRTTSTRGEYHDSIDVRADARFRVRHRVFANESSAVIERRRRHAVIVSRARGPDAAAINRAGVWRCAQRSGARVAGTDLTAADASVAAAGGRRSEGSIARRRASTPL
jgi:hypothetical protein